VSARDSRRHVQHLVVEEERGARDERPRADAPAVEADASSRTEGTESTGPLAPRRAAPELEFFLGAPRLPVAERNRKRKESAAAMLDATPGRNAPHRCDSRHDFTRSTLGAEVPARAVKIVVILLFVAILASLGSALFSW